MIRDGHECAQFFIGQEVEHSPAHGKNTLFVVGLAKIADIEDQISDQNSYIDKSKHITHIYFGANMSFDIDTYSDYCHEWEAMILHFLKKGMLCTLDFDVRAVECVTDMGLSEYSNFIPMVSVKLPYLQLLGYNATIKLDDKDFDATNPGIWCHSLHNLMDRTVFTPWADYTQDTVIGTKYEMD